MKTGILGYKTGIPGMMKILISGILGLRKIGYFRPKLRVFWGEIYRIFRVCENIGYFGDNNGYFGADNIGYPGDEKYRVFWR